MLWMFQTKVVSFAGILLLACGAASRADEQAPVKYPFVDWYGIWAGRVAIDKNGAAWTQDMPAGVRLAVQPARKSRIFIKPENPWEEGVLSPFNALYDDGVIRLWYLCRGTQEGEDTYVACAESRDGFDWHRPNVGLVEYQGSKENNLLFRYDDFRAQSIFLDPNAPADERYKAIAPHSVFYYKGIRQPSMTYERKWKIRRELKAAGYTPQEVNEELYFVLYLRGAASPDGLRWHFLEEPVLEFGRRGLDSQNICSYDPKLQKYVAFLRGAHDRRRVVVRAEGSDFRKLRPASFVFGADAQDPISDDVYASAYCRYPGSDLHLMFPAFHHRLMSRIDVQLATSRDGVQWGRPERKPIITAQREDGEYGMVFAHPNLVPLNEDEWGIMMHGNYDNHDWGERYKHNRGLDWRWAIWQRDRLVALEAPVKGQVTLVERVCQGKDLTMNFKAQKEGGWVKVELVEPPTSPPVPVKPIDGFRLEDVDVLTGDHLSKTVTWKGKSDLSALKGKKVAIRISLSRAKIFSISM